MSGLSILRASEGECSLVILPRSPLHHLLHGGKAISRVFLEHHSPTLRSRKFTALTPWASSLNVCGMLPLSSCYDVINGANSMPGSAHWSTISLTKSSWRCDRVRYRGPPLTGREMGVVSWLGVILDIVIRAIDGQDVGDRPMLGIDPRGVTFPAVHLPGEDPVNAPVTLPIPSLPPGRQPPLENRQLILVEDEHIVPTALPIVATGGRSQLVVKIVDQGQCASRCVVEVKRVGGGLSHGFGQCASAAAMLGENEDIDCVNGITTNSRTWHFMRVTRDGLERSEPVVLEFDAHGVPMRGVRLRPRNGGPLQRPTPGTLGEIILWIVQSLYNWNL